MCIFHTCILFFVVFILINIRSIVTITITAVLSRQTNDEFRTIKKISSCSNLRILCRKFGPLFSLCTKKKNHCHDRISIIYSMNTINYNAIIIYSNNNKLLECR